jgi:lipoprotein-anchoring transpeptidase ErfK/SrfK
MSLLNCLQLPNATPLHPTVQFPPQVEPQPLATYLEITTGCSVSLGPTCAVAYAKPNSSSTVRAKLRIGTVLYVKGTVTGEDGNRWYEIDFPETLRYPDRLTLPWYVPYTAGVIIRTRGAEELLTTTGTSTKSIIVDRSDQKLYAYEDNTLVRTYTISTGRELTPTPRGTFRIFRKTPSRYMQGPIPGISANYYDLPGVPWNLYFTEQGAVVHGAYWHESFGRPYSNGCVNVDPKEARALYDWADLGMTIVVRD